MNNDLKLEFSSEQGSHHCPIFTSEFCDSPLPTILVFPDWSGCSSLSIHYAKALTECGYIAIAVDLYGNGQTAATDSARNALLQPLKQDRKRLLSISQAALAAAQDHPLCDADNIAAIGFCFGGLAALDLARSASNIKGICSFHADLKPSEQIITTPSRIQALIQHADLDEWVSFDDVIKLRDELKSLGMVWEMAIYSDAKHGFMNFDEPSYDEFTATKAWEKLQLFLYDVFAQDAAEDACSSDSSEGTQSDCCSKGSCS